MIIIGSGRSFVVYIIVLRIYNGLILLVAAGLNLSLGTIDTGIYIVI